MIPPSLIDLAVARYLVRIEPTASASRDKVVAWLGPILQHYLTGPDPHDITPGGD